jgi:hypothetical protein
MADDRQTHPGQHPGQHSTSTTAAQPPRNPQPGQPPAQQTTEEQRQRAAAAKKETEERREERNKQVAERLKGRPTPTQEELDSIALGHHVQLSDDESGPDPAERLSTVRHLGGEHAYEHRQMKAKS